MIIIAHHTEIRLLNHLQRRYRLASRNFCFHIALSALEHCKKQVFKAATEALQVMPQSHAAHLFLCDDTDIFLTASEWDAETFTLFGQRVSKVLKDGRIMQALITYDIWLDWQQLQSDIQSKMTVMQQHQQQVEAEQRRLHSERIQQELQSLLDPALISSLYARREERDRPLVMVADDDQICRTLAVNALERHCSSAMANNGRETLKTYIERAPDVLFLDIGLPDVSGHDLLKSIFSFDEDAYVVMFSGQKDRDNILKALEAGARGFLGKPFTRARILEYVEQSPFVQEKLARVA